MSLKPTSPPSERQMGQRGNLVIHREGPVQRKNGEDEIKKQEMYNGAIRGLLDYPFI